MLSLKNLSRHITRTLLTLMGVAIGIALFVAISSYAMNLRTELGALLTNKYDLIVQGRDATSPFSSRVTEAEYQELTGLEGVDDSPAIMLDSIKLPESPYFILAGTSSIEPVLSSISLIDGRLPDLREPEILLGRKASIKLQRSIGDTIQLLNPEPYRVVGIYATGSRLFDNGMIMSLKDAKINLKRSAEINIVLLRLKDGYSPEKVIQTIQLKLKDLLVTESRDLLGQIQVVQVIDAISKGLSLVALVIAGIFVSNTMLMVINERTREIGILMAVGWSRFMISRTIFLETMIICFIGGLIGNLFGYLMLWVSSESGVIGLDWARATISSPIFYKSMGLSLVLGLCCSLYPALIASRLSPVQALRYER